MEELEPDVVVKRARMKKQQTQLEFSRMLGKSQAILSRYESGEVEPPHEIYMHCMHILNGENALNYESGETQPTIQQLIQMIEQKFKGPEMGKARKALGILLEHFDPLG